MRSLQWEYDLVEKPFCRQLKAVDRQWLEDAADMLELADLLTGRVRVPEEITVAP
jgi:hypothetical protein